MTRRFIVLPALALLAAGGCSNRGEITGQGISAVRSVCPTVGVPAGTGDVTLFTSPTLRTESALDLSATLTDVRSTCSDAGDQVVTNVTFQVNARRQDAAAPRDVSLPYFITVVRGGNSVVAKRVGQVALHFDAGQPRASAAGQATTSITRAAATLSEEVRRKLTERRKPGEQDAAIDPLSRPDVRQAVASATFEALVGFQLTTDQLKYNATR